MPGYARLALLPLLAAGAIAASPKPKSDPIAIYAMIDKVVIAPDTTNPQTIQIWGVFSVTERALGDNYKPAQRGYLYFTNDGSTSKSVRAEWADLRKAAGKGVAMGFGNKYARDPLRVRCPTEAPANPDKYTTSVGVQALSDPPNMSADKIGKDLKSATIPAAPCPK